jgi:hypothetical protein
MPVVDLIAALAQEIADHVLAWSLRAAGRGDGDEVCGGGKLRVKGGIDGIEDSLLGMGAHLDFLSLAGIAGRSKHIWRDIVEATTPFRITDVPIQFVAAAGLRRSRVADNKNMLYAIIGVLLIAVAVLGFNLYQAKKQPEGLQINVGPDGLKIQSK